MFDDKRLFRIQKGKEEAFLAFLKEKKEQNQDFKESCRQLSQTKRRKGGTNKKE